MIRFRAFSSVVATATLLGTLLAASLIGSSAAGAASTTAGKPVAHLNAANTGIYVLANCGCLYAYGASQNVGDAGELSLAKPIVGIASTQDGQGYWMAATDGGVFNYGDAGFFGSLGAIHLNQPIVGIAGNNATVGQGYWMVASDGGSLHLRRCPVLRLSRTGSHLNQPVVGMAATPDGERLLAGGQPTAASSRTATPGFYGSHGVASHLNEPIVGMAADTEREAATGWWPADGGIFTYGDAGFYGSHGGAPYSAPIVGIAANGTGAGYWLVASDGNYFPYGDASNFGPYRAPVHPVVGIATGP